MHHVRGEAIYQVKKDPTRPFVVRTQLAVVEAVGTKFGVDHQAQTVVTMAEGEVAIARTQSFWNRALAESTRAIRGQQVVVEPHRPMVARSIDVDAVLAWEKGDVVFRLTPVEEAILEFNRRSPVPLPMPTHPGALTMRIRRNVQPRHFIVLKMHGTPSYGCERAVSRVSGPHKSARYRQIRVAKAAK